MESGAAGRSRPQPLPLARQRQTQERARRQRRSHGLAEVPLALWLPVERRRGRVHVAAAAFTGALNTSVTAMTPIQSASAAMASRVWRPGTSPR